jgi:hypothetical protein
MNARVFRRIQRYGWDAAADANDRGWVPLIEGLTSTERPEGTLRSLVGHASRSTADGTKPDAKTREQGDRS